MRTSIAMLVSVLQMTATGVRPCTWLSAFTVPVTVTSLSVPLANGADVPCAVNVTWASVPIGAKPVPVAVYVTGVGPKPGAVNVEITGPVYVIAAVFDDWLPSWKITRTVPANVGVDGLPGQRAASGAVPVTCVPAPFTVPGTSNEFCVPFPNGVPEFAMKRTDASEFGGPKFEPLIVKPVEIA